jgi:hypothetical protein
MARLLDGGWAMRVALRAGIGAAAAAAWVLAGTAAYAAGALAIGACAAYGYAYDYATVAEAQAAALKRCEGTCKQVVTTQKGCVAFAIDGHKPCGPNGFANAARLGAAQNTALKFCHKFGGKDCVIRAWICDGRG